MGFAESFGRTADQLDDSRDCKLTAVFSSRLMRSWQIKAHS